MVTEFTFNCCVCSRLKRLIFGRLAPAESQSSLGGITLIRHNTTHHQNTPLQSGSYQPNSSTRQEVWNLLWSDLGWTGLHQGWTPED